MSRLVFDENYRIFHNPEPLVLDIQVDETTGARFYEVPTGWFDDADTEEITVFVPKDGFAPGTSNNRVDGGDLSTKFNGESMGTWSSQLAVTAFMDDGAGADDNLAYNRLGHHGAGGSIVVVPFGEAEADALAYCWPDLEAGVPSHPTTARDERQKFTAEFAVRKEPSFKSVIVVGS